MKKPSRAAGAVLTAVIMFSLYGCSAAPSESTVTDTIVLHFTKRNYRVNHIEIGNVSEIPLRERKYMEPKGYVVEVPKIILEVTESKESVGTHMRGGQLTFENALIRIQRNAAEHLGWLVTDISGIPLP